MSNKKSTRKSIQQAILRINQGHPKVINKGRKLSIASVAEEASISRASIHNNYPDLAEQIRLLNNQSTHTQRDNMQKSLKLEKSKNLELREEIRKLKSDIAKLTSINASLFIQMNELKMISKCNNVVQL